VWGVDPVFQRQGGTVPVVGLVQELLGVDSLMLGFGLPDDNLHAPNEKMHLPNFKRGIETYIPICTYHIVWLDNGIMVFKPEPDGHLAELNSLVDTNTHRYGEAVVATLLPVGDDIGHCPTNSCSMGCRSGCRIKASFPIGMPVI